MAKKRFGRRFGNRLMPPALQKIANELKAPGEVGRAIPSDAQAYMRHTEASVAAKVAPPVAKGGTEMYTYFTKVGGDNLFYQADSWVYLSLTLLDAGPVAVGSRENIAPVLSGKGGLLVQNEPFRFSVRAGQRVYITANTISRVRILIEPPPFGGQIIELLSSILGKGG